MTGKILLFQKYLMSSLDFDFIYSLTACHDIWETLF